METREGYKKTKIGWIPEDWGLDRLENCCQKITDGSHLSPMPVKEGSLIATVKDMLSNDFNYNNCTNISNNDFELLVKTGCSPQQGDVLFSKDGTIGKTFVFNNNKKIVLLSSIAILRAHKTILLSYFLFYVLKSEVFYKQLEGLKSGSALKRLVLKAIREIHTPLPPLPEQQKIAAILSTVDKKIESIEEQIKQTEQLKKGLMNKLLTEGIGHTEFKDTKIGRIPKSWEAVKLKKIATIERGKFQHRPRNDPQFYGGKHPFIQTGDVTNSNGKLKKYTQTLNENGLAVSKLFPKGTIIITIAANIGDTAIALFDVAFPDSLIGIIAKSSINNVYLEYYLRTQKKHLNKLSTVSAQKNINLETLKPLLVPKPPIQEQEKIATILGSVDEKIDVLHDKKSKYETLKKGLMQQLLTGRMRVKI